MNQIACPNCGTHIDVNDILAHQLEEQIQRKYQNELNETRNEFAKKQDALFREKEEFEEKKRRENELFQERFEQKLKEERKNLEEKLKTKLLQEQGEQFADLQKELNEKSEQIKELNRTKAEIEKLKREKDELKEVVEAESQRKLNAQLQEEKEKIRKTEEERNELRVRELLKQLEDQKKLTEEMKRKQEQGSMQLQGEVQELAIEEWLMANFPMDTIEEIRKGARGGDCIQTVHTRVQQNCGTIYYESKRAKDFSPSWIEKFKADIRDKGADIGVLVTEVMPSDMQRMGMRDGIWVCTYEEFKGLCSVLRETIIQISSTLVAQENKGDKMHLLYDFLTSSTFRMQVEAIVEGFTQMKADLESEKRSMQRIWKQREKQIEKVIVNTIDMYGSVKGIAGNAVQEVRALELPHAPDLDEED
ncbi:DUF2130 domain-containing protein [Fluviicola sp.]|uniref:DUF2130 domain-containing protein n=1 Tax=Fluviicola sp. TaxID=1917219 RepID=UPI0031E475F9